MKKHIILIITLWLLAITASFTWGIHTTTIQAKENAIKVGRAFFKLITISRDWNASHGGVYVTTTPTAQPNPFLPESLQTIQCENNQQLNLVNPAVMTAEISRIALDTEGISFRIISTKPLNQRNKANPWETESLTQFSKNNATEIINFTRTNNTTILNYMAPLYIQTQCLKCHSTQGYNIGDIAGGISVATPLNEITTSFSFTLSHICAAFFGVIILSFYGIRLHKSQELLIQAKIKAEKANKAKTNFLATMSHELRTPLSGIIGMTGIILNKPLPRELKQPLEDIETSAESLITIINDILDFSKLEVSKITLAKEPFNLLTLCDECIRLITPLAENKALKLKHHLDSNLPEWIVGDEFRLRQIILNLLQNSVKFTQTGSIHLRVEQQPQVNQNVCIKFSIIDTGIGLSQSEQDNLFQPYQQAGESISKQHGGTGLGLYICKQLTSLMHGTITIKSSKQAGSTFSFTAEFQTTTQPPAEKIISLTPKATAKKILLAEDSAINRKVLNKILTDYGYQCTCVNNGREAVNLAMTNRYDIILLDSRMPVLDGPATCTEIRKTIYGATTPIMALTADITEQEHGLCLDAGMDDVIIKPVDPTALLMTIDQLISRTNQNQ